MMEGALSCAIAVLIVLLKKSPALRQPIVSVTSF